MENLKIEQLPPQLHDIVELPTKVYHDIVSTINKLIVAVEDLTNRQNLINAQVLKHQENTDVNISTLAKTLKEMYDEKE